MNGIELIAKERQRQIDEEGWTSEHDAEHINGELANAAASYAMTDYMRERLQRLANTEGCPPTFQWSLEWWKPCPDDRIKELVKAGALIAAEIDRLQNSNEK